MHHQDLESVRKSVRQVLRERAPEFDPQEVSESVLLRGARVVGQQFILGHVKIHWLAGQTQLWLFEDGQPPSAIDLNSPPTAQKAA
jgi:hypothetical protein